MAKRRMFMENLIESDEFCSLPHASQALYFHFNMAADDDGMVGNPGRIIRSLKIAKKYYESLVESGFIIVFESGVVAITHWLSNNSIKKDRYTPTRFKNEFSSLEIQDGAMYIKASRVICGDILEKNDSKNAPQVSIGKDSLVKDREVQLRKDEESIVEASEAEYSIEECRQEQESIGKLLSEKEIKKEINKEKKPSEEGNFENDKSFSVSPCEGENVGKSLTKDRFVSNVMLYIMTTYSTLDDNGFIEYYEKRGWLDENNKPILMNYKKYVNDWMKNHPQLK